MGSGILPNFLCDTIAKISTFGCFFEKKKCYGKH